MKKLFKKIIFAILRISLYLACKEQKILGLRRRLDGIVSDLSQQYSSYKIDGNYLVDKVRSQHAFQISLALNAFSMLRQKSTEKAVIVDIGDSSGNHLQYLRSILGEEEMRIVAVNLDVKAIEKIKAKGIEAIETKAERLHQHPSFDGYADIFLSYQMLEQLIDPVTFLHEMATKSECKYFVITVPYVKQSRLGLDLVRYPERERLYNAETTHIFELSPSDWDLIFKFSGWSIVHAAKYTQYPVWSPFTVVRYLWRQYDYDGFYGVILEKDDAISKRYQSW